MADPLILLISILCEKSTHCTKNMMYMYFQLLLIFIRVSITFAKLDIRTAIGLVCWYQNINCASLFLNEKQHMHLEETKKSVLIYGPYRLANLTCVSHAAAQVVPSLSFLRPSHSHYTNDISLTYGLPERRYFGRSHEDFFRD